MWGSGIAKEFAKRFPYSYNMYRYDCTEYGPQLLGRCVLIDDVGYTIGCLFTSRDYGKKVDSPEMILSATKSAIKEVVWKSNSFWQPKEIHMCKINSGLFKVDWAETQKILELFPEQKFTVWEP
jgi:ADP-ribose 1''-phosphate phosphatase